MAVDAMKEENTKQKHILLLTDGQAEQSGYDSLLTEMRQRKYYPFYGSRRGQRRYTVIAAFGEQWQWAVLLYG